jgi:hypothetical protein
VFRFTIVCLLAIGAVSGCANLMPASLAGGYCSPGSSGPCSGLEAHGDCQPCTTTAMTPDGSHLSSNTLQQRLP